MGGVFEDTTARLRYKMTSLTEMGRKLAGLEAAFDDRKMDEVQTLLGKSVGAIVEAFDTGAYLGVSIDVSGQNRVQIDEDLRNVIVIEPLSKSATVPTVAGAGFSISDDVSALAIASLSNPVTVATSAGAAGSISVNGPALASAAGIETDNVTVVLGTADFDWSAQCMAVKNDRPKKKGKRGEKRDNPEKSDKAPPEKSDLQLTLLSPKTDGMATMDAAGVETVLKKAPIFANKEFFVVPLINGTGFSLRFKGDVSAAKADIVSFLEDCFAHVSERSQGSITAGRSKAQQFKNEEDGAKQWMDSHACHVSAIINGTSGRGLGLSQGVRGGG